jgi:heavy metal translocating P-type ATPase
MEPSTRATLSPLTKRERTWQSLEVLSALLGGGLLVVSFLFRWTFPEQPLIGDIAAALAALCVAAPIFAFALVDLLKGEGRYVMEQLVAIAVLATMASGDYTTATLVPLFMLVGHLLEERSILGAREAIRGLRRFVTGTATVLRDGKEQEVPSTDLHPGDMLVVRPGESFPADGIVRQGRSSVDQSSVTGESLPIDVEEESRIFAGTLNMSGLLKVEVTVVGEKTTLGRVVELLQSAQQSKAPVIKVMERYARHYLPLLLVLASVVLFITGDIRRAITVLIVSCPCAFVLSSPAAMVAALAVASRFGILVKSARFLERLVEVDDLVLDKTGTLTLGELDICAIQPGDGVNPDGLIRTATRGACGSRHPISQAICREARKRGIEIPGDMGTGNAVEVKEHHGLGMEVRSAGCVTRIGRREWLQSLGHEIPREIEHDGPVVWVAQDTRILGAFLLADMPRPEVEEALARLKDLGIARTVMLTGDRREAALPMGKKLGLDETLPELLPEQKLEVVEEEKKKGHTVAVVGDGVNDALALAAGDVGVAMGAMGCDVALQSADVVLMTNDLRRLATAFQLSSRTRATINVNVFVGAGFSILMLALAAFGVLSPLSGALLHNLGAVFVVLNSARLLRFSEGLKGNAATTAFAAASIRAGAVSADSGKKDSVVSGVKKAKSTAVASSGADGSAT